MIPCEKRELISHADRISVSSYPFPGRTRRARRRKRRGPVSARGAGAAETPTAPWESGPALTLSGLERVRESGGSAEGLAVIPWEIQPRFPAESPLPMGRRVRGGAPDTISPRNPAARCARSRCRSVASPRASPPRPLECRPLWKAERGFP